MQKQPQQTKNEMPPWEFYFGEGSLSASTQIQEVANRCNLFRPPTILFGNNHCVITNKNTNFKLTYSAAEALKYINYQQRKNSFYKPDQQPRINGISYIPPKLQIKHAEKWKTIDVPKDIELSEFQEISDSFFITSFKGKVQGQATIQRSSENVIPINKLGPQNQLKFYKQGTLYEDQLDDNGLIQYQYKFRTMADGNWFALIRCYIRVDDVVVMILDTRLYWEQGWNKIARQFMVKQAKWGELKQKGFDTLGGWTTNVHQSHMVYEYLSETFVENEYIIFGN